MLILLLAITIFAEILLFFPSIWKIRLGLIFGLVLVLPATSGGLFALHPSLLTSFLLLISAGRIFNLLRIAQGRMHQQYLLSSTRRTSSVFCGLQVAVLGVLLLGGSELIADHFMKLIIGIQLTAAIILFLVTIRNLRKTSYRASSQSFSDKELPTVTVAIPARNETLNLEECLRSILASDYPKLEIVVLDDCSADRTPDIIKQFAHDGVRFIKGAEPDDEWLAKNKAYEHLAREASGELIFFCGVDVRLGRGAIRELVTVMQSKQKQMISVMPLRTRTSAASVFIQPMRYWWELALPRRLFNRPPVLSTCWIISKRKLDNVGGFAAARRMIIPEAYLAKQMTKNDGYSFLRANKELDIRTDKSVNDQRETAIRLRYPQLHKRPELMMGLALLEVVLLVAPFIIFANALLQSQFATAVASAMPCIFILSAHLSIMQASNPGSGLVFLFTFPIAVTADIVLGLISMVQYEFFTVEWKKRNVCTPVMHVTATLPKL